MDDLKITCITPGGQYTIYGNVLLNMMEQVATMAVEKYIQLHKPREEDEDELLTTNQVMEILKVKSRATMHKYHTKHNLVYISSNPNLYRKKDIQAFLEKKTIR